MCSTADNWGYVLFDSGMCLEIVVCKIGSADIGHRSVYACKAVVTSTHNHALFVIGW